MFCPDGNFAGEDFDTQTLNGEMMGYLYDEMNYWPPEVQGLT